MLENVKDAQKNFNHVGLEDTYSSNKFANNFKINEAKTRKVLSKYESSSDVFKSKPIKSHYEFDYPMLSARSKFNNIKSFTGKYTPNTNKNPTNPVAKLQNDSNWNSYDPYHSKSNEKTAKDFLRKRAISKYEVKAIEKITRNLQKDMRSIGNVSGITKNDHTSDNKYKKQKSVISSHSSNWSKEMRQFNEKVDITQLNHDKIMRSTSSNNLYDIIEKESTNLSIKLAYDKPFANLDSVDDLTSPHDYLDMSSLNIIKNYSNRRGEKDFESYSQNHYVTFDSSRTPDIYHTLDTPSQINVYSELNPSNKSNVSYNIKPDTNFVRPLIHTRRPVPSHHRHSIDSVNNLNLYQKKFNRQDLLTKSKKKSASIISTDTEDENDLNIYGDKKKYQLSQNSINNSYSISSLTSFHTNTKESFKNDTKANHKLSNLVNVQKLPFQAKKNSTKLIKIKPSNLASKSQIKSKPEIISKQTHIKEFKCCILTDLKIGEGEFSELFQAYRFDLANPTKIAAKRLKNQTNKSNSINILTEISVLSQLGLHQNVIEFLGVYSFNNTMYIIFEFAELGDLKKLLDKFRKNNLNEDISVDKSFQIKAALDIATGMEYITSLGIVHKDLATRNILIDGNLNCKISDFGSCKSDYSTKRPIRWMAPESLLKSKFSNFSDVWSFGVTMWEIYTLGMTPYPGMTDEEVIDRINQWYRLYKPHECPSCIYDIMLSCWKEYSKARPTFTFIKNKLDDINKSMFQPRTSKMNMEAIIQSKRIFT